MPVAFLSNLNKTDVADRMQCLKQQNSYACIHYCNMKSNATWTKEDIFKCFDETKVDKTLYGLERCSIRFDRIKSPNSYLKCLDDHNVTVSSKERCDLTSSTDSEKLSCYSNESVPYDHDICLLEHQVSLSSLSSLFECYKFKANVTVSKQDCQQLYPDFQTNVTSFEMVYTCYSEQLGEPKDEEYCSMTSENNMDYFNCVQSIG
jgi:hypothetical protein